MDYKEHTFFRLKNLKVMHDQCNDLVNTNSPVAISFVNQNLPMIQKFGSTGSILYLHKSQIGPFIFSQPHLGSWFSNLRKYP